MTLEDRARVGVISRLLCSGLDQIWSWKGEERVSSSNALRILGLNGSVPMAGQTWHGSFLFLGSIPTMEMDKATVDFLGRVFFFGYSTTSRMLRN